MHARHLAMQYNVDIRGKKYYGIAYREPRSLNRTELLQKSYEDAYARWIKTAGSPHSFFFIEDTSVIIHALSATHEHPGVDVKYWMAETKFSDIDTQLRKHGDKRDVTVRSDVILHLPDAFRKQHQIKEHCLGFVGKTEGTITSREVPIETNVLYPWLDDRSFNKWFIPLGCKQPLSALPIEIANQHDIRKSSIGAMLEFLSNHNVFGDHPETVRQPVAKFLPHLLPPLLIVTGLPCAGKTTLGAYLSERCGYYHIEASDFMKRAFYERHGFNSTLSIERFAEEALRTTPDIVVKSVLQEIERSREAAIVITGFRSPTELEMFRKDYRGPADVECWYIQARQITRFNRSRARGRHDAVETLGDFRNRDRLQNSMGLDKVRRLLRDGTVRNELTIDCYLDFCVRKLGVTPTEFTWPTIKELHERPTSLENAVLIVLALHGLESTQELSTTQIAHEMNRVFAGATIETSKNNISRYFNFRPHAFYKITKVEGVLNYALSATGLSRALRLVAPRRPPHRI